VKESKRKDLVPIPAQIVVPKQLIHLQSTVGGNLAHWPQQMAMALFDFKSTKKESSWVTYEVALREFFRFLSATGLQSPVNVTRTHLTSYVDFLRKSGKADRTIRLYCAAASSFFEFLARPMDTKGTSLIVSNPWKSIKEVLPQVKAYEKSNNLREFTVEEYHKLLATCDRKTVIGKRDYAIMTTTLWTTRRRQEIARIRVADFHDDEGKTFIRFIQKGGHQIAIDLTAEVHDAIKDYWHASGRQMKADSPAWVATTDAGKYLNAARNIKMKVGEQPLSASSLDALIKSRGSQAGLDTEVVNVHMHGLRHLGARVMKSLGKDVKEIKERLGHADLKTTDIYLGSMDRVGSEGLADFAKIVMGK
jgi:site-specific recombinase XerD